MIISILSIGVTDGEQREEVRKQMGSEDENAGQGQRVMRKGESQSLSR